MIPENLDDSRTTRRLAFVLFVCAMLLQPVFAATFWQTTWDDSAITLAFARSFAQTGLIELTPGSGVVEGYSTTLWMLLLAGLAHVFKQPATLLAAAKAVSCGLGMMNVVLVRQVIRGWGRNLHADLVAGTFGLMELTLYESINAMETPLMLTLMLLAVLLLPRRGRGRPLAFAVCVCLFSLLRFEAFLLIAPLLLFVEPIRLRLRIAAALVSTVLGAELLRLRVFDAAVPNTIFAKQHLPYSTATKALELQRHLLPAVTLGRLLAMLPIALAFACLLNRKRVWPSLRGRLIWNGRVDRRWGDDLKIAAVIAATGLILDFGVGQNWGPPDRELFATLPFLIYLLIRLTLFIAGDARRRSFVCMLLVALVAYRTVRTAQRLHSPAAPLYMPQITVRNIARLVPPVERIREAAGLPSLTFATPDVGGVALFGEHLRILDVGLLCDRRLAHTGYAGASAYILNERQPEVMEIHNFWATLSGIDDAPALYARYVPMLIDGKRYFVRRDIFWRFAATTQVRNFTSAGHPQPADDDLGTVERAYPDYSAVDYKINGTFGTYFTFTP